MKTRIFLISCLLLTGILLFDSCKKDKNDEPQNPEYPQLLGTWQGTNDRGDTVILKVNNNGATMYVYYYKYGITYEDGGTYSRHNMEISNSSGIAPIINKSFTLVPSDPFGSPQDSLSGTFDTETLKMTGKIKTTFTDVAGSPVVLCDYSAIKQ